MTTLTTPEQIEDARSVIANLDGLQAEISAAVKRKPGEPVTVFQLRIINAVIAKANTLLGQERPIAEFEAFNSDDIPVFSDVAMIVSQYVEAFEKLRCENIHKNFDGTWIWTMAPNIQTVAPRARK